jgi:1,4-alpha-glucan branching enzyme
VAADNADDNVVAFLRKSPATGRQLLVVGNFSPVLRHGYRVGAPKEGFYTEVLNTDSQIYGGSNFGNDGGRASEPIPWNGKPHSVALSLPPLSTVWFEVP